VACALLALASAGDAAAATFTVSGHGDPSGAACAGTTCSSLRAAVAAADQPVNTGSTIALGGGTYTLTGLPLSLTQDLRITGAGELATAIDQTAAGNGVIAITGLTPHVTISSLTITGGRAVGASPTTIPPAPPQAGGDAAGAIADAGALTLDHVVVTGNQATGGTGGGTTSTTAAAPGGAAVGAIDVIGSLTLDSSAITHNVATGGTGGTAANADSGAGGLAVGGVRVQPGAGAVSVIGSDVSDNSATGGSGVQSSGGPTKHSGAGGSASGGLAAFNLQPVLVASSTFDANRATGGDGGGPIDAVQASIGGTGGTAQGGGVYAAGPPLTMNDVSLVNDIATGGSGGYGGPSAAAPSGNGGLARGAGLAVVSPSTLTLHRGTLALDVAAGGQAGASYTNSTSKGASGADGDGGGAYVAAVTSLVDTTVSENRATGSAGAPAVGTATAGSAGQSVGGGVSLQPGGQLLLASDTLAANAVPAPPGGGPTFGGNLDIDGPIELGDTIVSGGLGNATTPNCAHFAGTVTDDGNNLESTAPVECGLATGSDQAGVDPQLGPLTDHGGPGPTLAPSEGSAARGAGGSCLDRSVAGKPLLNVDERGTPRHAACDIGAYETQPPTVTRTPALAGPATVGTPVSCPTSGFAGDAPLRITVNWLRAGVPTPGAVGAAYVPITADVGTALSCTVQALNDFGIVSATSNAIAVRAAPIVTPPVVRFAGASLGSSHLVADERGHISVVVSCPASTPGGRCAVTLTIYGRTGTLPRSARASRGRVAAATVLAAGSTTLNAKTKRTLKLSLRRAGRTATRRLPARVRVSVVSRDRAGARVSKLSSALIVAAPKPRRRR
jgi:hypothetical protein